MDTAVAKDNLPIKSEKSLRLMVHISKTLKLAFKIKCPSVQNPSQILRLNIHNNEKKLRLYLWDFYLLS
jgi:hypothetical protein